MPFLPIAMSVMGTNRKFPWSQTKGNDFFSFKLIIKKIQNPAYDACEQTTISSVLSGH
jgi:hypothetical protein